jgi:hypothetical protein
METESIDDLFNQLNIIEVNGTINILPNLSNKDLSRLSKALVEELKNRKNNQLAK